MDESRAKHALIRSEELMSDLVSQSSGLAADAARRHLSSGGKRIRARLALSSASRLGLGEDTATRIAAASELTHNASLVHDDVQDRSTRRRGTSTIWAEFGTDMAICVGDLMISAAYAAAAGTGRLAPQLIGHIHSRVSEVIKGQCADLNARHTPVGTLEDYERIARSKSAPLLALPIDLALIAAQRRDALVHVERAAGAFAAAYQMADDIDDVMSDAQAGEVNIVAILGGSSTNSPEAAQVRKLAAGYYLEAGELARRLPNGCGAQMVAYAQAGATRLAGEKVPA